MVLALAVLALGSCRSGTANAKAEAQTPPPFRSATIPDRVAGEYIVTVVPGADDAVLRKQYGEYGIREIVDLGRNTFLMKLSKDPGLDVIRQKASQSDSIKAVQPNFIYRGNR